VKKYPLAPNGIFASVQGEGHLLGTPMVFVRLAGCSVGCPTCDTDYRVDRRATARAIADEVGHIAGNAHWAWVTGGEPTDHDLTDLRHALGQTGLSLAIATSGVRPVPHAWDWISVSPHLPGKPAQWSGHEVKLVAGLNGLDLATCDDRDYLSFPYRFASDPAWVQSRHGWRVNVQAQKVWHLP
jgi:organic radical activating enzyme